MSPGGDRRVNACLQRTRPSGHLLHCFLSNPHAWNSFLWGWFHIFCQCATRRFELIKRECVKISRIINLTTCGRPDSVSLGRLLLFYLFAVSDLFTKLLFLVRTDDTWKEHTPELFVHEVQNSTSYFVRSISYGFGRRERVHGHYYYTRPHTDFFALCSSRGYALLCVYVCASWVNENVPSFSLLSCFVSQPCHPVPPFTTAVCTTCTTAVVVVWLCAPSSLRTACSLINHFSLIRVHSSTQQYCRQIACCCCSRLIVGPAEFLNCWFSLRMESSSSKKAWWLVKIHMRRSRSRTYTPFTRLDNIQEWVCSRTNSSK